MISTTDPETALEFGPSSWRLRLRSLRRAAAWLAALVVLLAITVLVVGWLGDVAAVRRLRPDLPGMAVSTALGLAICGLFVLLDVALPGSLPRYCRPAVGGAALGLAVLDLGLLLAVPGRGVDQLVFVFSDARGEIYMSPATALCLALAGASLLVVRRRSPYLNGDLFGVLAGAGLFLTVLSLTGYAFDSRALHEVFVFSAMALHTAAGFFLLFLALLLSHPAWGWMRIAVGGGPGSITLRQNLPFVLLGPFVFCWLTLLAVESGLFNANFRLSVLAITSAAGLVILLFWSALRENADARDLLRANERLRRALSDRNVLLQEVYHRVKNNLQFIDAMLALETSGNDEPALEQRLAAIRARVHAISQVHQHLIGADDLATVDLRSFLREVCVYQAHGTGFDARGIRLDVDAEAVPVQLERAVPIGLIVTELVSNAVKHAFPDGREGVVKVAAKAKGDEAILLTVGDSGVGRAAEAEGPEEKVGSMIMRSLVAQLGAQMTTRDDHGRHVELTIPLNAVSGS